MRVAFSTLGCKVNQYETQVLIQQFSAAGFDIVDPDGDFDVFVLNSCTVTATADRKSRQAIRRAKRTRPDCLTVLTGCYPQASPDEAAQLEQADVVLGNRDRAGTVAAVHSYLDHRRRTVSVTAHPPDELFEPMGVSAFSERTRASLKIEDGCDRFCAYCIIPFARGRVRSKPLPDIEAEAGQLAAGGYREIVLTGINLSAYGSDLVPGTGLADAVEIVCRAAPGCRVRLGSLEPDLVTARDLERLSAPDNLCPQFHLSLQSGCNATLSRMNRRYDTAFYHGLCAEIRRVFPGCAITTDIMVGFPGETEKEFLESLSFVRDIGFARAHVFIFSARPGTAAALMPNQIPRAEKESRLHRMLDVCDASRRAFFESRLGAECAVLFEQEIEPGVYEGYAPDYTPVRVRSGTVLAGTEWTVRLTEAEPDFCSGTLIEERLPLCR